MGNLQIINIVYKSIDILNYLEWRYDFSLVLNHNFSLNYNATMMIQIFPAFGVFFVVLTQILFYVELSNEYMREQLHFKNKVKNVLLVNIVLFQSWNK